MGRVHEVLHWANRRAVAEEVTRRGYRLSGETLNRWVRDEKEFPAMVERIVFDLFGISETQKETAPSVTRRLMAGIMALEAKALVTPDELASAEASAEALEAAMEVDARLAAELEAARHTPVERGRDRVGGRADVSPGSKRQKR